mmetsp:Transcript_9660/g.15851  ORF Transcript_9660/g.15851 Transcript_9660/m.15851 type:complete len:246 (+) Transcript_9660:74-811(+)|eukprot:CAMPEP_0203755066 /NCGR_PEP_ID=MMETSP0098-20131031/8578_1 /ASSEMBLY_ACC=CAM_ASM_000208 /TAXON_ID=96639 /ORGANISM=" , Strain NY0313808BC1" /LENGTH=245 /DNA_ID=CAMNT_0050646377 /DNA_START=53 /DNA_END=790 /DNA_ORIENTATION=-
MCDALEWDYGAKGPSEWGSLKEDWAVSDSGRKQSPVDLPAGNENESESKGDSRVDVVLRVRDPVKGSIIANGVNVMVNTLAGTTVNIRGRVFELVQFHFHSPAEHTIQGTRHALELHLVHKAVDGQGPGHQLAVVGILFEEGKPNSFLETIFGNIPSTKFEENPLMNLVNYSGLDLEGACNRYSGSLTTPPCTETVEWIVLKTIHTCSASQIEQYKKAVPFDNYRPVQPLNDRAIHSCGCLVHCD